MKTPEVKVKVYVTPTDTITIPRNEYNNLIAAKAVNDLILATARDDGYGSADIIKGLIKLDKYRSALTASEARISDMEKEAENLKTEISNLQVKIESLTAESSEEVPEESPDA